MLSDRLYPPKLDAYGPGPLHRQHQHGSRARSVIIYLLSGAQLTRNRYEHVYNQRCKSLDF